MEVLENALFLDQVPPIWTSRAYPSLLGLTSWFVDLLMRLRELETWSTDFVVGDLSLQTLLQNSHSISLIAAVLCLARWILQSTIIVDGDHAEHSQTKRVAFG